MEIEKYKNFAETLQAGMFTSGNINASLIILNIVIGALVGYMISYGYRKHYTGVLYQKSFATALILVTMVTTSVIMVISGNIILSLGLVGALSIVRFRAAIKDPLDVVYIFWAVGSGISIGVSQYSVALIGFFAIYIVLHLMKRFFSQDQPILLILKFPLSTSELVERSLKDFPKRMSMRSKHMYSDIVEVVYEIPASGAPQHFLARLKDISSDVEVRIINYGSR